MVLSCLNALEAFGHGGGGAGTYEILSGYKQLRRWQAVQAAPRWLQIRVVLAERDARFIPRLRADLQQSLPNEVELEFIPLDEIPLAPRGKLRLVIAGPHRQLHEK